MAAGKKKMHQIRYKIVILGLLLFVCLLKAYSGEPRSYWNDCFSAGMKSMEEFVAYVDTLSVKEVLLLQKQAAEEYARKLQKVALSERENVENEYFMVLGLVMGRFIEREGSEVLYRMFIEPVGDLESPHLLRKALILTIHELQDENPKSVRLNNYKLVSILGNIMKSSSEEIDIRILACCEVWLFLQREQKRPPASDKEKEILATRITENVALCRVLHKDRNTPASLVDVIEKTQLQDKKTGNSGD
ncbi:MAG: hypothetical protein GX811_09250 [Lentisphaerae bacterium]|nr:hypothetical protein [Lentisphaerota bacterium]